jgi:serine protease inhibitor ecotin
MKKLLLITIAVTTLLACDNQQKEKKVQTITQTENSTDSDNSKFGRKNFAVIWKWTTTDVKKVEENIVKFSEEMNSLWKNGDIENVYYNGNSKIDKLEYLPNNSFFIKAKTKAKAEAILNELVLVKEGLVTPMIYPVGTKWLGRNKDAIHKNGLKNSFVVVWNRLREVDQMKDQNIIIDQTNQLLKLNENGDIENVYWDLEKTANPSANKGITDFVFFVNANTQEEARKICDNLPFTKAKIASYNIQSAGIFWLGEYK